MRNMPENRPCTPMTTTFRHPLSLLLDLISHRCQRSPQLSDFPLVFPSHHHPPGVETEQGQQWPTTDCQDPFNLEFPFLPVLAQEGDVLLFTSTKIISGEVVLLVLSPKFNCPIENALQVQVTDVHDSYPKFDTHLRWCGGGGSTSSTSRPPNCQRPLNEEHRPLSPVCLDCAGHLTRSEF